MIGLEKFLKRIDDRNHQRLPRRPLVLRAISQSRKMKLSELKSYLSDGGKTSFTLPNGKNVPAHFHVTEVGETTRNFMDCGGTMRQTRTATLQLWTSIDLHHRLEGMKLLNIIELSEKKLGMGDLDVEVEFQGEDTISRYSLAIGENGLSLVGTKTACLAEDACGIPGAKQLLTVLEKAKDTAATCCAPGGGCC